MVAVKRQQVFTSRSDVDWREAKAQNALAGFIFVCNSSTLPDLHRNLFGLPAYQEESVRAIRRGMPLFLFNYSTRRLYGVYEAASDGGFNIDPFAWENTDSSRSGRYSNPVSRYPAQVRVRIRVERPPLEEDVFRPVLDHLEGLKFRLDLNALQVQRLLHLFGVSGVPADVELMDERIRGNVCQTVTVGQDPESPRSAFNKSDSDCYSECSSRGTNFGEDEWTDEAPNDDGMYRGSMQMYYQQENGDGILSERLSHISLDDLQSNGNGLLESKLDKDLLYSAVLMSGVPAAAEDIGSNAIEGNGEQMVWKGNSRKGTHRGRMEMVHPVNDSSMLLRLHDTDPAVNSSSINCLQASVPQPLAIKRQDNVVTVPMIPAQVQSPFPGGENMIYIPVQTVQCQQRGLTNFPVQNQRSKWNDQRKYSRGLLNSSSRKQTFDQDKPNKPKDVRYHKPPLVSDNHQTSHIQSQKLQLGQVLVPLCTQRAGPLPEQGQLATLVSPVFMSPHVQGLAFSQSQIGAGVEDSDEGYEMVNDVQPHPDGLQNLLHNGHFLVMQSVLPTVPASPPPMSAGFVEALHFDILQFARFTRPSPETQLHAEAAIDCVRKGVKMVWPEADVEVFGSFATGLCLQHSDVDLAIVGAPLLLSSESMSIAQVSAFLIRELASSFEKYEWCESINVLDTASMPVLKCHCRPSVTMLHLSMSMPSIAIDITIGGIRNSDFTWNQANVPLDSADVVPIVGKFGSRHTGGSAREYVLRKIWELPALAPLVLLLKSFLHHKGLSNVYSGGLGSFSLTLLLAFYLERIPISREIFGDAISGDSPLSPTASSPLSCMSDFSEDSEQPSLRSCGGLGLSHTTDFSTCSLGELYVRRAADVMERVLTLWESGGSPYLGILLLGFLQTFGFVLDLSSEKIVLKGIDGSPGGSFKRDDRHVALWIDDPLRPGVNVGAGSFGMFHVQAAFREMLQVITNRQLSVSPPQCNDKGCQDLAAMGQLHLLSRLIMEADDYL